MKPKRHKWINDSCDNCDCHRSRVSGPIGSRYKYFNEKGFSFEVPKCSPTKEMNNR